MANPNQKTLAYVGTYTTRGSEGIYVYTLDPSSGALTLTSVAKGIDNPSFLVLDSQRRYLFAANEVGSFAGTSGGAVSAFSIEPETGALTLLNQQPTHGAAPCHMSIDRTDRFVLVANYNGGNLSVLPILDDGRLGKATHVVQHQGKSVNPRRQKGPHAHSITLDPENRYAFAADLGIDKIMIYRLGLKDGKLVPHDPPWIQTQAGAGPRHFDFHPTLRYAYVINELDSTLSVYRYNREQGTLEALQTVSTLPKDFQGENTCADVHVSASGKFVYGSNRGHDSIAIFAIDPATGKLSCVGHQATQGRTPRNFAIDPTGTFLLAANQDTDNIVTFQIDPQNGKLTPTGHVTEVPAPVCVKIVPMGQVPA